MLLTWLEKRGCKGRSASWTPAFGTGVSKVRGNSCITHRESFQNRGAFGNSHEQLTSCDPSSSGAEGNFPILILITPSHNAFAGRCIGNFTPTFEAVQPRGNEA